LALERTFAIIKPDAVSRGLQGEILSRIHKAGFAIVAIKTMRLTKQEAGGFYAVHRERPFFGELTDLGTSIGNNCTHGSDAADTAAFEIGYFFAAHELI